MNKEEQKTINQLVELVSEIKQENNKFKEEIRELTTELSKKVEKKTAPINLEAQIFSNIQNALVDSIIKTLSSYDSGLSRLVKLVIDENSSELKQIISDSFKHVIGKDEFKQSIVSGFSHKVARTIISNNDGLFDKVSNELKQDAVFKSKMALAVATVVDECLKERK